MAKKARYEVSWWRRSEHKTARFTSARGAAKKAARVGSRRGRRSRARSTQVFDLRTNEVVMYCSPQTASRRKDPGVMFKAGRPAFAECTIKDPAFKRKIKSGELGGRKR